MYCHNMKVCTNRICRRIPSRRSYRHRCTSDQNIGWGWMERQALRIHISLVAWTMFQFQYFCMTVCSVCCWAGWALRKQELPLIHWTFTLSFASMSIDDPLPKRVLSVVIEVKACTLNRWRIRRALSFHRLLHSAVGAAPTWPWRLSAQTFKPKKFQNYQPSSKCS